jgi:AcrR family transcriptional regulator
MSTAPVRRVRADAQRNREAILRAARETFEAEGILAPLDRIATAAGIGNATLYRNFPTREDLLAAVIEDSVCELLADSDGFERDLAAEAALREWLNQLAWRLRMWQELPTCIATAYDDDSSPVQPVCERLTDRTGDFLERLQREGGAARSVTAEDLFQLVTALAWAVDRFGDDPDRARERVALATAGVFVA